MFKGPLTQIVFEPTSLWLATTVLQPQHRRFGIRQTFLQHSFWSWVIIPSIFWLLDNVMGEFLLHLG